MIDSVLGWHGLFTVIVSILAMIVLMSHAAFFMHAGRDPLGIKLSSVFFFGSCVYLTTAIFGIMGMLDWPQEYKFISDATYMVRPWLILADVLASAILYLEYKKAKVRKR